MFTSGESFSYGATMAEASSTLCMIFAVLCGQLGDGSFRRRDAAYKAAIALTPFTLPQLHLFAKGKDAEAASRATCIIARWRCDNAEWLASRTRPTNYHKTPWLWIGSYSYCGEYLRRVPGHVDDGKDYNRWRYASQLWVADQYRGGRTWRSVVAELDKMVAAEKEWIRAHASD